MANEAPNDASPPEVPEMAASGRGSVGREIFEQTERLVATGMGKTDAFKQIAQESGRREGAVSANYYRVARQQGGGSTRARRGRPRGSGATSPRRTSGGSRDVMTILDALEADLRKLREVVAAQEERRLTLERSVREILR
ncbi:hypothetical protein [Miltoncostaea oceani]|uniref:hypothetical protein n=1 Tax=Miltoncostaea oceani TaxID=2843216 RepID=UPI001C3C8283|nr:hypothetical protein [Miltoncostaea oceani]